MERIEFWIPGLTSRLLIVDESILSGVIFSLVVVIKVFKNVSTKFRRFLVDVGVPLVRQTGCFIRTYVDSRFGRPQYGQSFGFCNTHQSGQFIFVILMLVTIECNVPSFPLLTAGQFEDMEEGQRLYQSRAWALRPGLHSD